MLGLHRRGGVVADEDEIAVLARARIEAIFGDRAIGDVALTVDDEGRFDAPGTYSREHGGPTRAHVELQVRRAMAPLALYLAGLVVAGACAVYIAVHLPGKGGLSSSRTYAFVVRDATGALGRRAAAKVRRGDSVVGVAASGVKLRVDDMLFTVQTRNGPQAYAIYMTTPEGSGAGKWNGTDGLLATAITPMLESFRPTD